MNKRLNIKLFSLICLIAITVITFTSCSDSPSSTKDDRGEPIGTAYLNVTFPENDKLKDTENIENAEVPFYTEETTILDLLKEYCDENKISVVIENGTYTYVQGIGGLQENDLGSGTGWVFEVNNEMVMEGASTCKVKDGDSILWKYVDYTDLDM